VTGWTEDVSDGGWRVPNGNGSASVAGSYPVSVVEATCRADRASLTQRRSVH